MSVNWILSLSITSLYCLSSFAIYWSNFINIIMITLKLLEWIVIESDFFSKHQNKYVAYHQRIIIIIAIIEVYRKQGAPTFFLFSSNYVMMKYINGAFGVHTISNLEIEKKVLAQLLPANSSFYFWRKKCPDLVNGIIICIAN